ncbi:NF-kappa-B essential modulator [Pyrgilauda ruficollis]|uniref:NF-kappa-B essential modulator n=1 Tax=Pyrgilauda ruficollis TaxID=221976 RepID=UPI001B85D013|nr:NF-kappa-B essential modulator [Pyrgilauda ruficollis]
MVTATGTATGRATGTATGRATGTALRTPPTPPGMTGMPRTPPGTSGTSLGTSGTPLRTPRTPPGTSGTPSGTSRTPPGTSGTRLGTLSGTLGTSAGAPLTPAPRLVALRARVAVAELRAQDVSCAAELQLQGLRRQLEQDKAQVQAQVTSLLGELRESQNRLERSRAEREHLERRAHGDAERCQQLEEVAQGHQVQLDQLRLQVTNLETALRVERRGATEEKRKLVQLQAAYHHLFQEYDAHIKASLEGDKRSQVTQEQLSLHLWARGSPQPPPNSPFPRARLEEMRNRHSEPAPAPAPAGGFGGLLPPPEEGPDLCCPKCQYKAPDMDTLQIHVMDCIK